MVRFSCSLSPLVALVMAGAASLLALNPVPLIAQGNEIALEKIYLDDFETLPVDIFPRIEFSSDSRPLFASPGDSRSVRVIVYDEDGNAVPNPGIDWSVQDGTKISVMADSPTSATVESVGSWHGSTEFTATYAPLNLAATGYATMADPDPSTKIIPSDWVIAILGDRFSTHDLILERNSETVSYGVNDIIVSGDRAGVMVRIETAETLSDSVRLSVSPALITEAFDAYDGGSSAEATQIRVKIRGDSAMMSVYGKDGEREINAVRLSRSFLKPTECDGNLALGSNVRFRDIDLVYSIEPFERGPRTSDMVESWEFGLQGTLRVIAQAEVDGRAGSLQGTCERSFPTFTLPSLKGSVITLAPRLAGKLIVGISANGTSTTNWISLDGIDRSWRFQAGLKYADGIGWTPFESFEDIGDEPRAQPFSIENEFSLNVEAKAEFNAGISACIGTCAGARAEFANIKFFRLSAGPFLEFSIALPINSDDRSYTGPAFVGGLDADASIGLGIAFFESGILQYLPISFSTGFWFPILEAQVPLIQSPAVSGSISCSGLCEGFTADGFNTVTLDAQAPSSSSGTAIFYRSDLATDSLLEIARAPFDTEQAQSIWQVPAELPAGSYDIFARLALAAPVYWFTETLPFASAEPIGRLTIGNTCFSSTVVDSEFLECFPDPGLRECVRSEHLGSPIDQVTELGLQGDCDYSGVASLAGLEFLTELTRVNMRGNQISDISPLSDLSKLTYIRLIHNQIVDLSPLTNLTSLQFLWLHNNKIVDVPALSNLTQLERLVLSWNEIASISALSSNLNRLTVVALDHNQLSDVSPLLGFSGQLTHLELAENGNDIPCSQLDSFAYLAQAGLPYSHDLWYDADGDGVKTVPPDEVCGPYRE